MGDFVDYRRLGRHFGGLDAILGLSELQLGVQVPTKTANLF